MNKFIKLTFVAAFVTISGYGVYANLKSNVMSDLLLANVEALADSEYYPNCPNGCVDGYGGCNCYHYYPQFKEYYWP